MRCKPMEMPLWSLPCLLPFTAPTAPARMAGMRLMYVMATMNGTLAQVVDPRFLKWRTSGAPTPINSHVTALRPPAHVVDPRSMNLMATSPSSWRSQASCTMPEVPSKRSQISS